MVATDLLCQRETFSIAQADQTNLFQIGITFHCAQNGISIPYPSYNFYTAFDSPSQDMIFYKKRKFFVECIPTQKEAGQCLQSPKP